MLLASHTPLGLGHGGLARGSRWVSAAPASVCRQLISPRSTGSSSLCALKHGSLCAHAAPFIRPQQHGLRLRAHSSSPNSSNSNNEPSPADPQQQAAPGGVNSPSARNSEVPSSQQPQGAELAQSSSSSSGGGGPSSDGTPKAKQDVPEEEASARVDTEGAPSPQKQQEQQQQQQQLAAMSPWKELAAAMAALAAFFRSASHGILALLNRVPMWVQQQHLKKLREASDEDPKNADKHAALLSELNKVNPREVISRVESKEYAAGAAVVAEYLRALVNTGKLAEYTASQGMPERGQDHRSMSQLLKEMQAQLAAEEQDNMPGSSLRRPLHVTVQGGQLMQMNKPTGPLQAIWALLTTAMLIVGMAFLWLVGSQAMRRMQAASPSTSAAVGGMPSSSSSGSPSLEPKEYKKEELPEKSIKSFKDVRGCDEAKEELQEVVEFLKNPAKFTRLGAKLPKGVLLTGPPGTGKTLLARAVAGEAGVPFFYRAGSEFEELYVGVGSRRMRALFQAAKKKSPCIVFIDEIDAIGGNRKHWENHARKTLNQLLVEMDGFESNEGVIVMAATNLAETLDPALKRPGRFDRQVAVPLPDIKGRTELIEYYLHDKPFAADVDRDLLARQTQGFSGADISNLVNEAALTAAKEGADIIAPHMLDQAFDKIRMGVERKTVRRTEQARKRTAYHEAGHAIVALHTPGASPIHKATIVPRGHALGMVSQVGREDEFSINRQQMLARIWVCMGGQVAEELMFGRDQVTTGATDDLRQATDMARFMVSECGMNDVVGPMYVSEGDARVNVLSETVKERIDAQVRDLLVEARKGVMQLLQSRVADLHSLAGALIEVETLTSKQINELLGIGAAEVPGTSTPSSSSGSGGSGGDRQKDPMDPAGVLAPGTPVPTAQNAAPSLSPSPPSTQQHRQHNLHHQQEQPHHTQHSAQQQQGPPFAVMGVQPHTGQPSPSSLQHTHDAAQAVLASTAGAADGQQGPTTSGSQQLHDAQGSQPSSPQLQQQQQQVESAVPSGRHSGRSKGEPDLQPLQRQRQQRQQRQRQQHEDAVLSSHLPLRYEHAQGGGKGSEVTS